MVPQHALVDDVSHAILVYGRFRPALLYLNEITPDSRIEFDIHYPNYPEGVPLNEARPSEFLEWTWDRKERTLKKGTSPLTEVQRAKSDLAVQKYAVLTRLIYVLGQARQQVISGVDGQEMVYLRKRLEAERFRDTGYDAERLYSFPFVAQYAEFADRDPRQAADEIIFKAKLDDEVLANTEILRLKYMKAVREADNERALNAVLKSLLRDVSGNSLE